MVINEGEEKLAEGMHSCKSTHQQIAFDVSVFVGSSYLIMREFVLQQLRGVYTSGFEEVRSTIKFHYGMLVFDREDGFCERAKLFP